jgi:ATP-dependent Clp protease ATP-binding subunit ClpA
MIQRELETALGRKLLAGEIRDGSKVMVDAGKTGLQITGSAPANVDGDARAAK